MCSKNNHVEFCKEVRVSKSSVFVWAITIQLNNMIKAILNISIPSQDTLNIKWISYVVFHTKWITVRINDFFLHGLVLQEHNESCSVWGMPWRNNILKTGNRGRKLSMNTLSLLWVVMVALSKWASSPSTFLLNLKKINFRGRLVVARSLRDTFILEWKSERCLCI